MQSSALFKQKKLLWLLVFTLCYSLYKLRSDTGEGTRALVLPLISTPLLFAACPKLITPPN